MNGGAWEYVMGNMSERSGSYAYYASYGGANYTYSGNEKYIIAYANGSSYKDQIAYNRGRLGDATSEIVKSSTSGWYGDYSDFLSSSYSWLGRGGNYVNGSPAGVFYFSSSITGISHTDRGARAALVVFPS